MPYVRYFKNKSGATKSYFGIEFANNEIKQIPDGKIQGFSIDADVLSDLATGDAVMSQDGTSEYNGSVADQIAWLQDDLPVRVQTEFEDNSLIPKFIKGEASFGSGTTAVIDIKVPGTFPNETRFIKDGFLMVDAWAPGCYLSKVQIIDIDNQTGAGANTILKSYIDDDAAASNRGWYLWPTGGGVAGEIDIENAGGVGNLVAELYLRVEVTKPTAGVGPANAYVNLFWCAKES